MVNMKEYQRIYKSAQNFMRASYYLFNKGYNVEYYKTLTSDQVEKLARRIQKLDARVESGDDWVVLKVGNRRPKHHHGGYGFISHNDIIRIAELEDIQEGVITIYIKPTAEILKIAVRGDETELISREKVRI